MKYIFLGLFILLVYLLVQQWSMKRGQRSQPSKGTVVDETKPDKSKKDGGRNKSPRKVGWAVIALLLLVAIGLEWWGYDFQHVKGFSDNVASQASPLCYKSGWGLQCFGTEYVDGDGVTSLTYDILPLAGQKPAYTGQWTLRRDAATNTCRGEGNLLSQGNDAGLEWEVEILPTPCESLARFNAKARGTSSEGKKTLQNISFRKE